MNATPDRLEAAHLSGGVSNGPIYAAALSAARAAAPAPKTVLDFGSGTGQLLPLLEATFPSAEIHATDIIARVESIPRSVIWHRGDLNDRLPLGDASFDLVCAIEVIEHLENPRHVMREIARVLHPGGIAILTTPNLGSIKSLMTLAARGHHALFDDGNYPAHITPVGEVDLERMASEAGLKLERFFYTNSGTVPKLLHSSWQSLPLVGSRLKGRRFSDNYGAVLRKHT